MPTIDPVEISPLFGPNAKKTFADWLFSGFQQKPGGGFDLQTLWSFPDATGMPLSPNIGQTLLPNVWGNWQPWDAGTMFMANYLAQGDPRMQRTLQYGGAGNVGLGGLSSALQFGAPSQAGQFASNMAQFGVASPGSGDYLSNIAQFGAPTASSPASQLLLPIAKGQAGPRYRAPSIPQRTVSRRLPQ